MPEVVGQDPQFEVACGNCGAKLRFTRSDVYPGEKIDYDTYQGFITCPQKYCQRSIRVPVRVSATEVAERRRREAHDL